MQASLGFGASLQQSLESVHKLDVDECWQDGVLRSGLLFLATLEADQAQGVKVLTTPSSWVSLLHLHFLVMQFSLCNNCWFLTDPATQAHQALQSTKTQKFASDHGQTESPSLCVMTLVHRLLIVNHCSCYFGLLEFARDMCRTYLRFF